MFKRLKLWITNKFFKKPKDKIIFYGPAYYNIPNFFSALEYEKDNKYNYFLTKLRSKYLFKRLKLRIMNQFFSKSEDKVIFYGSTYYVTPRKTRFYSAPTRNFADTRNYEKDNRYNDFLIKLQSKIIKNNKTKASQSFKN